jgi:2'-5' RNA ligase
MNRPGHSVLLVPVPELEGFVRSRTAHYDADYVSADPAFMHAHITALGPFLEEVGAEAWAAVAAIAGDIRPFDFTLARLDTFPNGIIHLVPEPSDPFRSLTARLAAAFPECPPYGGEFDDVRPHLTLDLASDTVTEASTRASLRLPVRARARRLDLAWYEPGNCHVVDSWRLGTRL